MLIDVTLQCIDAPPDKFTQCTSAKPQSLFANNDWNRSVRDRSSAILRKIRNRLGPPAISKSLAARFCRKLQAARESFTASCRLQRVNYIVNHSSDR